MQILCSLYSVRVPYYPDFLTSSWLCQHCKAQRVWKQRRRPFLFVCLLAKG